MKKVFLCLESWAGRTETSINIIKNYGKKTIILLLEDCLKGKKGEVLKVPSYTIKWK